MWSRDLVRSESLTRVLRVCVIFCIETLACPSVAAVNVPLVPLSSGCPQGTPMRMLDYIGLEVSLIIRLPALLARCS
jgi:hypothetical protein